MLDYVYSAAAFTGNAVRDFSDTTIDPVSGRTRDFAAIRVLDTPYDSRGLPILPVMIDVGVPPGLYPPGTISGWDMRSIYFQYDDFQDQLLIGIDCFGICGDADGDGDAGRTGTTLMSIGGLDLPNLAQTESFAIAIDLNLDVADVLPSFVPGIIVPFDFIIGVPGGQPANAELNPGPNEVPFLPCSLEHSGNNLLGMQECFGIYRYQLTASVPLARRFLAPLQQSNGTQWPAFNYNPSNTFDWPTSAQPHLEWAIGEIANLRASVGAGFTRSNKEPWSLLVQAFSGSLQDAGFGEDYIPSQVDYLNIQFPCLELDVCDICLGNGDTCLDCSGIPNGPTRYDVCDVCGGDSSSCRDCHGVPNGPARYDRCDVCGGNGNSCFDCMHIPNGPNRYDLCDVCGGDSTSCLDCLGHPNGAARYDVCDVCNGNGHSCLDCRGIPNGPHTYQLVCL